MNRVTYLGELEQMLLWTVLRLQAGAYGLAIRDELARRTERRLAPGAVYTTLDRLVNKGYLKSWLDERHSTRAGRPRRYFAVTQSGKAALRQARDAMIQSWTGLEALIEEG